jgi:hypothetical protein
MGARANRAPIHLRRCSSLRAPLRARLHVRFRESPEVQVLWPLDNRVAINECHNRSLTGSVRKPTAIQGIRGSHRQPVSPLTKEAGHELQSNTQLTNPPPRRSPWNKGKLPGSKSPVRLRHVSSMRAKLQIERRGRGLVLFNLAIESKLRSRDILRCGSMTAPNSYTVDRATIRQENRSAGPVRGDGTTRQSLDEHLRLTARTAGDFLFAGRGNSRGGPTTRQQHWSRSAEVRYCTLGRAAVRGSCVRKASKNGCCGKRGIVMCG